MTRVLMRERRVGFDTERRRPCEVGGRDWSSAATSKEHLEPPETGRGKEGFSPRAFRGNAPLSTINFELLASRAMRE